LKRESLSDAVVRIILDALLAGELHPGSRIVEADLADKTGISRGPVREALRQLEGEGILTSTPSHGTYVTNWPVTAVQDAFDLRVMLEVFSLERAIKRITPDDIATLRRTVADMADCARRDDVPGLLHADMRFHEQLFSMSGSPMVQRTLNQLHRQLYSVMAMNSGYIHQRLSVATQHSAIVDCLENGDSQGASEQLSAHIRASGSALVEQLNAVAPESVQ
jgi:DNA-binding GntR family transcriptional regulator